GGQSKRPGPHGSGSRGSGGKGCGGVSANLRRGRHRGSAAVSPKWRLWLIAGLAILVGAAAIYLPTLRRQVKHTAKIVQQTEEQARRELTQAVKGNAKGPAVKAKTFLAAGAGENKMRPPAV